MTAVNERATLLPGAFTDPSKQAQIYQYLEALKKDELGWKRSADNIVTNNFGTVEEHFLLLQVIEDYLKRRYASCNDIESVQCVRSLLSNWMEKINAVPEQPAFLSNKMAHIFSLVFAADFPNRWPDFMSMFLSRSFESAPVSLVIFYLKTVLAIDSEVVDRDIQRSKQAFDRNTNIKDSMREICIKDMVQSWYTILSQVSNVTAQCLCLDVIAAYVDWIDLELVANDIFVPVVIARLSNKDTSESAVHAVSALIEKGMDASKKLPLVIALTDILRSGQLLNVNQDSDEDDVLRAGSLLHSIGAVLLDCHSKFRSESNFGDATKSLEVLESNFDAILKVLDHEDPELSELVVHTARQYAQLVRDDQSQSRVEVLSRIIEICLRRYSMGEELNVDGEGQEELDFLEYRKSLRTLMNSIGSKRPDLLVAPLEGMLETVLTNGQNLPIQRVEAVVQLIYALSELLPSNFVQAKDGWLGRAAQMPITLLSRIVLDRRSATVHVLFFEIACRYERLLAAHPQPVINLVAAAFLDERGIAISVSRVRTRIVYLFCRFVKAHKSILSPLVSEVVGRLAPLLAVSPEAEQFLSAEDQGFIFEATGTLIVFGELEIQQKAEYIRELATTLGTKFQTAAQELQVARSRGDARRVELISQFMSNIIGYCSRTSKAFNNTVTMKSCDSYEIYLNLLNLFLEHLSPENAFLLEPVRQLAHRLVVCLDSEVIPILPTLMSKLTGVSNDLDSMNHLLIFCNQVVAKHKKEALTTNVNFGVILTTAARFSVVPEATELSRSQDEAAQRNLVYVQRAFLQFLHTITANGMIPMVISDINTLNDLMEAVTRLALSNDQASQKLALQCLAKVALMSQWQAGLNNEAQWERALRTALEVPSLAHISIADAGSTLVVHEVSTTLNTLKTAHPQAFVAGVQQILPPQMASNLLEMLETTKSKELDKQIMLLYAPFKTQVAQ